MNLLLDTQAFIHWTTRPETLPVRAHDAVRSAENIVRLSLVSAWEMQIKSDLNKLKLDRSPRALFESELATGLFALLQIQLDHIDVLSRLPNVHKDPFDRMLIAQALHENLTIVTGDETIARYPVPTLWR